MTFASRAAILAVLLSACLPSPTSLAGPARRTAKIDPRKMTVLLSDEWELPKFLHTLPEHLEVTDADGPRVRIQSENPIDAEDVARLKKLPFVKSVDVGQ
jgi:hypothetical protein